MVGHNLQHTPRYARYVCHRHLGQLFNASFHHVVGQFAQGEKLLFVHLLIGPGILQCHVKVEHRYVRGARLDGLGPLGFLGQAVHGGVNLLVHLNEGQIGVHAKVERHAYDARPVACLALNLAQSRHLQQLAAHRCHHRVLQLACR